MGLGGKNETREGENKKLGTKMRQNCKMKSKKDRLTIAYVIYEEYLQ